MGKLSVLPSLGRGVVSSSRHCRSTPNISERSSSFWMSCCSSALLCSDRSQVIHVSGVMRSFLWLDGRRILLLTILSLASTDSFGYRWFAWQMGELSLTRSLDYVSKNRFAPYATLLHGRPGRAYENPCRQQRARRLLFHEQKSLHA